MLRKDKYTQIINPTPWNRTVPMSSACEACADVPACVYGRASVRGCALCQQTWRHGSALPPRRTNKLHSRYQMALVTHPTVGGLGWNTLN